jgi:hypothetical protein
MVTRPCCSSTDNETHDRECIHYVMRPTVHMNGTSAGELYRQYEEVVNALRVAEAKLHEASPNGRDYYPQLAGAMVRATDQHVARLRKLMEVRKEMEVLLAHVADAL